MSRWTMSSSCIVHCNKVSKPVKGNLALYCCTQVARDCADILATGHVNSDVYTVRINNNEVEVYCDMTTDAGGWLVTTTTSNGGSQNATLVVLVGISSLKFPKAFLIRSGAQRNFAHTFVLSFPTERPSQIFTLISN